MKLYVIRHGKTDWNAEKRFQGNRDIELNSEGREVAGKLGRELENLPVAVIYSSPLIRAYETACLIRGHRNIKIIRDDNLREVNFGECEGWKYTDWMNTDNPRKYFFDKPELYVPPKGGETFEAAKIRCKNFLKNVIEPYEFSDETPGTVSSDSAASVNSAGIAGSAGSFDSAGTSALNGPSAAGKNEKIILLVAHGALLGAMTSVLENRSLENYWGKGLKGNCEATIYNFDGKVWTLEG